ncbi:MAG: DUF5671 domain-containing protein [Patescibacteria group bacterium]|jgi:hypothetical protein|nr:DUF5671 domain-containing protein [Patescibacteria group bacterium]
MEKKSISAKFAFFYLLSLASLISMALAVGNIIFQIINKNIVDILNEFSSSYSSSTLRFAIASILVSAPIYYLSTITINKSLKKGELKEDSEIRRWLTYLIMFASFMVLSGWFIGVVFNFLGGELSLKFGLKALTAIGIAAAIFSYYFYDIRRHDIEEKKDKVVLSYFYSTLLIVVVALISAFIFVESPTEARERRIDNEILSRLDNINMGLEQYYLENSGLPETLDEMLQESSFIKSDKIKDPRKNEVFQYEVIEDREYKICANFSLSNEGSDSDYSYAYLNERWPHPLGEYCFTKNVENLKRLNLEGVSPKEIIQ